MKKLLNLLILFSSVILYAQTPETFNYQAVARNAKGITITEAPIGVQFQILKNGANGTIVYSEKHNVQTSSSGLFSLKIGTGNSSGNSLNTIDWSTGNYWLQVAIDSNGGENYETIGSSQLVSVPYALHAKTVENDKDTKYTAGKGLTLIDNEFSLTNANSFSQAIGDAVFSTTNNITSNEPGDITADSFVFGSTSIDNLNGADDNARMLFHKGKGAFRAGFSSGDQWNIENIGNYSIATGYNTRASTSYSTASGFSSNASGNAATASGFITKAEGNFSFASGFKTKASGMQSVALGSETQALNHGAVAMGIKTVAKGANSFVAGEETTAIGKGAVALGSKTIASKSYDFATGVGSHASGTSSIAVGNYAIASANSAVSMGSNTEASEFGAIALGLSNKASGAGAFASGFGTNASAQSATTMGSSTVANAQSATAMGIQSKASGVGSLAAGANANAIGEYSIALGDRVKSEGKSSFATGLLTTASGENSTAMGIQTKAIGLYSTAIGFYTNANGDFSTATGSTTIADGPFSFATGIGTVADYGAFTAGNGTKALGRFSASFGDNTVSSSKAQFTIGTYNLVDETKNELFVVGNGNSIINRSNAFIVSSNGDSEINGLLTIDPNNDETGYTLPASKGQTNQVLTANADGTTSWTDSSELVSGVFTKNNDVISGGDTNDDFIFGSTQLSNIPNTSTKRMFFDKSKGAFRTGLTYNEAWDDENVGYHSFGSGINTVASANSSTAFGFQTTASGNSSIAMGSNTTAEGVGSTAIGNSTIAKAPYSMSVGINTVAEELSQLVIGQNNILTNIIPSNTSAPTTKLFVVGNGVSPTNRSNAFYIERSGDAELNGLLTIDPNNNDTGYTLPASKGQANQVLTANADGSTSWKNGNNNEPIFTNGFQNLPSSGGLVQTISENIDARAFIIGKEDLYETDDTAHYQTMFFDRGVFRAGEVSNNLWRQENIGGLSFAVGLNTTASGYRSFASGTSTKAEAESSTAMGAGTTASGRLSFAIGRLSKASGESSTAMGDNTTAIGRASIATGYLTIASEQFSFTTGNRSEANGGTSFATGQFTKANGNYSAVFGSSSESNGIGSFASGASTKANANYSATFGRHTISEDTDQFTVGSYNTKAPLVINPQTKMTTTKLFVVGNGISDSNRSNAFTVYKNGNATLAGTLTQNSDRRLKTNITPIKNTLAKVEQINGVNYTWKDTEKRGEDLQLGLIAQEVQAQYPELVKEDTNGALSVNYIGLVPVLLESIKELKQKLDTAENDNASLKADMNNLSAKVELILSELAIDTADKN